MFNLNLFELETTSPFAITTDPTKESAPSFLRVPPLVTRGHSQVSWSLLQAEQPLH